MKKTLLFLMLVFAMNITAQSEEGKSRTQWLNLPTQQTLKQQESSKQSLAAKEFSQILHKPSALQQKLQKDRNASQSKENGAQRKIKKTEATGIAWNDIGTLSSWTETINFDPENAELIPIEFVDDYGYTTNILCYAVKFTLAQDELISASSTYYNDFTLYAEPEAQQEVIWGYNLLQPLKAGVYYLLISDTGYLNLSWGAPFEASIDLQVVSVADISLPGQQNVSITKENSILIANTYYTLFYKFTLAEDAVVSFGSDFDETAMGENMSRFELDLITDKYMINASNSDIPLKAGTYYIAVYGIFWDDDAFWEEHTSVEAQMDIQTKTLDAPLVLSVPSEQDFSLTPNNAYNLFGYYSVLYSLHLDDIQIIEIDHGSQWAVIIYEKETWTAVRGFYPGETAIIQLGAGDYYLTIADYNSLYDGGTPVNGHLTVSIPLSYATLDFSETIAVGETKIGDDASLTSIITEISYYYGVQREKVAAWHFTAQAGHIYKFVMECYAKASYMQPTLSLFHAPNTGDIYADAIRGAMPYINASSGTGSLTWQSDVDGDVNVMFFFESPESDVMFKLTLNEIEATHTDTQGTTPAYENITLPFVSLLHFDPAYNAYWDENVSEYYKLYRLTLAEKTLLTMESGFNAKQGANIFLKIFTDEDRTQLTGNSWGYGEGESLLLDAGTYYLVLTDYGYYNYMEEYAECLVELSGSTDFEEISTVTVAQLMDDPAIPVIDYTLDLPYTDSGYFVYGTSQLVNDPNFFLTNVFAKGYKLTGMDNVHDVFIVDCQPAGESVSNLDIYQKEEDGSYTKLENLFVGSFPVSDATYIYFSPDEARDYYIMASTSGSYPAVYAGEKYPGYQIEIVASDADGVTPPEPTLVDLPLPGEIAIESTAASATKVYIAADASSVDIKLALMALEITATTQASATVALVNNPTSWEINDLAMEASFVVIPIPYLPAETYAPATVQLEVKTGIDNLASETIRIANSGNGFVAITGLLGKEAITLIDVNGRILRKTAAQGATATIETNALPQGVYIVAVQNGKRLTVLKFIK
ncbi:MAG: T9SS type A sorting domain-containing protein [Dysgonamonadaceae bacterium]|jgi:hypothetical protein|nr:T9SS type A sorting domain-containing protein [Dysgonamonadaceae bacterium]